MKKIIIAVAIFFAFVDTFAQQDPHYTQYMYNMNVVNPAYAGSHESLAIGILGRQQWIGFDGAPNTYTLAVHAPIGDKTGIGFSAISDEIGPVTETNVNADFSYSLELGQGKLAFGLKGGFTFHKVGLTGLTVIHTADPNFASDVNKMYPNVGAGVYYYTDKYYISASMPNMLETLHFDEASGIKASEVRHYFVTAGYVFDLNDKMKLKPSVLAKSSLGGPLSLDTSLNFFFNEKFELGASYRLGDSFSGMLGFMVTPAIRLGYAYDRTVSDINLVSPSSHEVMLNFDLNFNNKVYRTPRYF